MSWWSPGEMWDEQNMSMQLIWFCDFCCISKPSVFPMYPNLRKLWYDAKDRHAHLKHLSFPNIILVALWLTHICRRKIEWLKICLQNTNFVDSGKYVEQSQHLGPLVLRACERKHYKMFTFVIAWTFQTLSENYYLTCVELFWKSLPLNKRMQVSEIYI